MASFEYAHARRSGTHDHVPGRTAGHDQDPSRATGALAPGKQTLTERLPPGDVIQRKAAGSKAAPATGPSERPGGGMGFLQLGGGTPLPEPVRGDMERAFGADFSAVRVHVGAEAAALGAEAFARGTDLHFAPGRYDPDSEAGRELIGHELAHVVQQSEGRVAAGAQYRGVAVNQDGALEREADELGARAARGETVAQAGRIAPRAGGVAQGRFGFEIETGISLTQFQEVTFTAKDEYEEADPKTNTTIKKHKLMHPGHDQKQFKAFGEPSTGTIPAGGTLEIHTDHNQAFRLEGGYEKGSIDDHFRGKKLTGWDGKHAARWPNPDAKNTGFVETFAEEAYAPVNPLHTNAVEHAPYGPIVELVSSAPLDEHATNEPGVRAHMQQFVDFVDDVDTQTAGFTQRVPLNTIVGCGGAPPNVFVGSPTKKQHTNGSIQTTYGVRLDRISELFKLQGRRAMASPGQLDIAPNTAQEPNHPRYEALRDADTVGAQIASDVLALPSAPVDDTTRAQVKGFCILVANALLAGQRQLGHGWGKNRMGMLFYKSQLSSVVTELKAGTAAALLTGQVVGIRNAIFTHTGANPGDPLWAYQGVSNQDWLDEVLAGTNDVLFQALKNPDSNELAPEPVGAGGEPGVVMENRALSMLLPTDDMEAGRPKGEWADIGVRVWKMLRAINGNAEPDVPAIRQEIEQ